MKANMINFQQTDVLRYVVAEINEQTAINYLRRLFWVCVHVMTLFFVLSALFGNIRLSAQQPINNSLVEVKSDVSFPIHENSADPNQVLALVNIKRAELGLPKVAPDAELSALAEKRASDMVANSYYAHKDMRGKIFYDYLSDSGSRPQFACENLSLEPSAVASSSVESWSASTHGHRECMLDSGVEKGGYASFKLYDVYMNGKMQPLYLVVAIHSTSD